MFRPTKFEFMITWKRPGSPIIQAQLHECTNQQDAIAKLKDRVGDDIEIKSVTNQGPTI